MARSTDDELVELLRPNEAVFGTAGGFVDADPDDDLPADAFDDEPRPRWTVAVAGLLVTGLLAAEVIAAAPWNGDDTATPPTSTIPATTTTVATPRTTVPRDPLAGVVTEPAGWVIGTGGFWKFGGAVSYDPDAALPGRVDVWAAPDATRTGGRWVSVEGGLYDHEQLVADGVRTIFGNRPGVIRTLADGVTRANVDLGELGTAVIETAGLGLDEVTALAAGVVPPQGIDGEMISYPGLLSDAGLFGLPIRATQPGGFGVSILGQPLASSFWIQDSGASITVDVWAANEHVLTALPLVLATVDVPPQLQATLDDLQAQGRDVSLYAPTQPEGSTMVVWRDGDQLITLTGIGPTATLAQLLVSAGSARPADDAEWRDLLIRSQRGFTTGGDRSGPAIEPTGEFVGGGTWNGVLTSWFFFVNATDSSWYTPIDVELSTGSAPAIRRFVAPDITIVVAVDPTGAATTMRVTLAGVAPIEVPMQSFGDGRAALYPWLENVAATVELLDATGAVVSTAEV